MLGARNANRTLIAALMSAVALEVTYSMGRETSKTTQNGVLPKTLLPQKLSSGQSLELRPHPSSEPMAGAPKLLPLAWLMSLQVLSPFSALALSPFSLCSLYSSE